MMLLVFIGVFCVAQMLRATIIENHQSRDHRDAVKKDVVKIASAVYVIYLL